jgi:hypothetical protein
MTDLSLTHPTKDGFAKRIRLWFFRPRRRPARATDLDTLSDHMRRDIGMERDPLDQMSIRTAHDAMRFSG